VIVALSSWAAWHLLRAGDVDNPIRFVECWLIAVYPIGMILAKLTRSFMISRKISASHSIAADPQNRKQAVFKVRAPVFFIFLDFTQDLINSIQYTHEIIHHFWGTQSFRSTAHHGVL
jgi:hypothetical protein